jgi:hypothetical protein
MDVKQAFELANGRMSQYVLTFAEDWTKKSGCEQVIAFALKNKKNRFFLPSKDNFFGGVPVPVVMVDSGCNTLLLPLRSGEDSDAGTDAAIIPTIDQVVASFPVGNYDYELKLGKGVGVISALTLSVEASNFNV